MVLSGGGRSRDPHSRLDPIIAIARDGTVTKANSQARRAFGNATPIEGETLGSVLARLLTSPGARQEGIVVSVPVNGELHDVTLVLAEQDPVPPISLRPVQEAPAGEISQAQEPRGPVSVADFIAHELKNNIAIMLGLSQLLETAFDAMKSNDRVSALHGIESEGEHALLVLDGLLKLVEARRQPELAAARVPLHSVIRRVITDHKRRHPARTFELGGDATVFATGNSTWIQLAIANLISNAEKVTPGDQSIQVNLRQEGRNAVVSVLDQGRALPAPLYAGLWEIYSKGVPAGIEVSGSGIGLSLCKELVEAMGGTVWAGPRSHGGSGFTISLPSLPEPSPYAMKPP